MIASRDKAPERGDIESLLPWHAVGTLSRRDSERVEQALAQDAELARRFELVREEMVETIHLNETLGAPSARTAQRLFAAIESEQQQGPKRAAGFDLGGWLAGLIESFSPRTLAWAGTAAAVAIVIQAGLLAGVFLKERQAGTQLASRNEPAITASTQGSFALVRFNPTASAADLTRFFDVHKASLVEGPRAGGVYRIRVSTSNLSKDELGQLIGRMAEDKNVVAFIVPSQ